jgi:CO/xanthine dehydrogenase FAD-binding subunit
VSTQSYYLPQSVEEATNLLADKGPDLFVLAGGTLAMPLINEGISTPDQVMGLKKVGLNYMKEANGHIVIGATATLSQMALQEEIPILQEAARAVGGWAIRNMGTVGGNLFAPPPGGDFAVALLALDAELVLKNKHGERIISIGDFYTGFMMNALLPGEIVTEVRFPIPKGQSAYLKFGRRHQNTPSIVTVAVNLVFDANNVQEAKIAMNAVGPFPFRARNAEEFLVRNSWNDRSIQTAAELVVEECEPFTDPIASEWYRRKMIPVIVKRTLKKIDV